MGIMFKKVVMILAFASQRFWSKGVDLFTVNKLYYLIPVDNFSKVVELKTLNSFTENGVKIYNVSRRIDVTIKH